MPAYRVDVIPGPRGGAMYLACGGEEPVDGFVYGPRVQPHAMISQGLHRADYTHDDAVAVAKMINSSSWIGRVSR